MRKIVENVFSSWANLGISVVIAFLVSPVIVNNLGKELYGVWTLIVSVTGYFTVLDFGVNTAIVRYISKSSAQEDHAQARQIYSTSLAIFGITSLVILLFSFVFGYFFQDLFKLYNLPRTYLYGVFMISALDLAGGLVCSVFLGSLAGLQEFKYINGTSVLVNVVKSALLLVLLRHGFALLTLALLQLSASGIRALCQYLLLKKRYHFISFSRTAVTRDAIKLIYSYSVYSFIIAVALKLLFYTDSVVIGAMISVSDVAFYAIPSTLLDYLEKFVWAMIAVLVPVISANEATDRDSGNSRLYIVGTRYTLMVSMPVVIALYFYGDDFIRIWMGLEFGMRSSWVLRILLIGFGASFSQLIAHGILKGTSRHRVLAYILALEALANLGMSLALSRRFGIEGVAVGTMVPLLLASLAIVIYTCKVLGLNFLRYFFASYAGAVLGLIAAVLVVKVLGDYSNSYLGVVLHSFALAIAFWLTALPFSIEPEHRSGVVGRLKKLCFREG